MEEIEQSFGCSVYWKPRWLFWTHCSAVVAGWPRTVSRSCDVLFRSGESESMRWNSSRIPITYIVVDGGHEDIVNI
jgi:hypothetical protein